jgi:hypothetical protein
MSKSVLDSRTPMSKFPTNVILIDLKMVGDDLSRVDIARFLSKHLAEALSLIQAEVLVVVRDSNVDPADRDYIADVIRYNREVNSDGEPGDDEAGDTKSRPH